MVLTLSKYLNNIKQKYLTLLKNVFYYILDKLDKDLIFISKDTSNIVEFTDSDFFKAVNKCKLIKDFVFMLAKDCILYQLK